MVRRLISGPGVFICDGCVSLCVDVIEGRGSGPIRPASFERSPLRRLARRLGCLLDRLSRPSSGGAPASG
jgi:ClpX C4-type zinc finger